MISKELLSEVLGEKVLDVKAFNHAFRRSIDIGDMNHHTISINNLISYCVEDSFGHGELKYFAINIYELAFLTRDYLYEKYSYELGMNSTIEEIFKNATQFYESML